MGNVINKHQMTTGENNNTKGISLQSVYGLYKIIILQLYYHIIYIQNRKSESIADALVLTMYYDSPEK